MVDFGETVVRFFRRDNNKPHPASLEGGYYEGQWPGMTDEEGTILAGMIDQFFIKGDQAEPLKVVDVSSNNLITTAAVVRGIQGLHPNRAIDLYTSDILYKNPESKVVQEAQATKMQLASDSVTVKIRERSAQDLGLMDIGGDGAHVIIDRLGALWHSSSPEARTELLKHYYSLLAPGGVLVVDDYTLTPKNLPKNSTGDQLRIHNSGQNADAELKNRVQTEVGFDTHFITNSENTNYNLLIFQRPNLEVAEGTLRTCL